MAKKLFLLAVILCAVACGKDAVMIPEEVMDQQEMVDVLIDIRVAEGMIGSLNLKEDSAKAVFKGFEKKIFQEHGIDSASYTTSYNFYLTHPELYLEITDVVLDSLKSRNSRQYSRNY